MSLYKRLFTYLRPYCFRFLQAGFCMAMVALATTLIIWLIRTAVDEVLIAKDSEKLLLVAGLLPLIYLLKGVFSYGQNYLMNQIGQAILRDIRNQLYAHIQQLSLDFFHRNSTGNLMSKITNDTSQLRVSLTQVPVQIIRDGLTLIFLLVTIFYLHWKFALITILLLPLASIPVTIYGKKMRRSGRKIQARMAELFTTLQEGITGNIISKIFCKEKQEIERFSKENSSYYSECMRWVRADISGAPIMEFLGSLAVMFLLCYGGKDVIDGIWTTGSFFAFLSASIAAYKPVKDFTSVNSLIQQGVACAERIFELLDEQTTVIEKKGAKELPPFQREIVYQNVSFSYGDGPNILKKINLKIRKGEILAIVGPSGSGKTTLTQLLPRLFDPQEGAIFIDSEDLRNVTLKSLRKQIGIVTQETILFNETVKYNIAYGSLEENFSPERIRHEQIEEAARIANAHEFISELPNQYETVIGEKGIRLSGGQRQRLAIARAVLKNPPILILDEATSSLDTESERLVQEAIERLMEHRTVLVVAHRLSTVRRADRIIVLQDGQIIEEGNHEKLMGMTGSYKKLYELQIH